MPIPENPLTRGEMFLNAAATGNTSGLPDPKTREEMYLEAIAEGGGGGGTDVVANPTLAGTEADLTGLQVGDTKYKVPAGGGGGVLVVTDTDGALNKTWQEIRDALLTGGAIVIEADGESVYFYTVFAATVAPDESSFDIVAGTISLPSNAYAMSYSTTSASGYPTYAGE